MVEAIARYTCNACEGIGEAKLDEIPRDWIKVQVTGRGKYTDEGCVDHYAHFCPACTRQVLVEAKASPQCVQCGEHYHVDVAHANLANGRINEKYSSAHFCSEKCGDLHLAQTGRAVV